MCCKLPGSSPLAIGTSAHIGTHHGLIPVGERRKLPRNLVAGIWHGAQYFGLGARIELVPATALQEAPLVQPNAVYVEAT